MAPPIIVTEDTPPDMLAGSMDLTVVLPNRHSLKMSVGRSTPMMDLLVQVTTAHKLSPGGYIIQPLNDRGTLPYKPSTPIGTLDAWTINIVPKPMGQFTGIQRHNQPFEQTFRLQVHLPRNQLFVARISPKTRLSDILLQVCSEKNLDPSKYSLRHPGNLDQVLSLSCTLADYKLQELTLVYNRTHPVQVSTVDIMSLQRDTSNPAFRNTTCEGSVSSGSMEGRSLSPVPSDESSASPPPPLPPSRPTRKRRPAPKPPIVNQKPTNEEKSVNGVQSTTLMNHSRNSSDSSGYHEASVLSESPHTTSVPDSLSQTKVSRVTEDVARASLSQSMTDVSVIQPPLQPASSYNSMTSLSSITGRKKKAAPPPPPSVGKGRASSLIEDKYRPPSVSSAASSTTTLDGNELNLTMKSATLPASSRLNSVPPTSTPPLPLHNSTNTSVMVDLPATLQDCDTNSSEVRMADEEIDRIFSDATKSHSESNFITNPSFQVHDSLDWEYQLPAPPTFRDEARSPSVTEFETITVAGFSEDLNTRNGQGSLTEPDSSGVEINNITNCTNIDDNNVITSTLRDNNSTEIVSNNNLSKLQTDICNTIVENTVGESRCPLNQVSTLKIENDSQLKKKLSPSSTLDNFTITTYKNTKPIEVFEDDSIKSSAGEKRDKSKDDAVFRAPKPRVKEPNLSRTSSFSMENKLNGPMIKRSVSYVSLLAANMPRHSQPYRAHLTDTMWPRLRKTTSELNIDIKEDTTEPPILWQPAENPPELQSIQVLRNILSRSQANLTADHSEGLLHSQERQYPDPELRPEDNSCIQDASSNSSLSSGNNREEEKRFRSSSHIVTAITPLENSEKHCVKVNWNRSSSQDLSSFNELTESKNEVVSTESTSSLTSELKPDHQVEFSSWRQKNDVSVESSLNVINGPPSIHLSTWGERPKQQIAIKDDGDYRIGFGKKSAWQDEVEAKRVSEGLNQNVNYKIHGQVIKKQEDLNLESRSKSISDLSRIPVVTAVELKKPFFENESTSSDGFIGVNSLARKFGAPQRRPVSVYGNFLGTKNVSVVSDEEKLVKRANTIERNIVSSKKVSEASNKCFRADSTSEIKALAKIRSGGFIEESQELVNTNKFRSQTSLVRAKSNSSSDLSPKKLSNTTDINSNNSSTTNLTLGNNVQIAVKSVPLVRQDKVTRPVNLQPVVKGFTRVIISPTSNLNNNSVDTPKTAELSSNISNTRLNQDCSLDASVNKANYFRKPSSSTAILSSKGKTTDTSICTPPAPPPFILRPVGERKGIKFLPPPAANPRDLLMSSIRSFRKDDLKSSN